MGFGAVRCVFGRVRSALRCVQGACQGVQGAERLGRGPLREVVRPHAAVLARVNKVVESLGEGFVPGAGTGVGGEREELCLWRPRRVAE